MNLYPISVDILYDGMKVESGIYCAEDRGFTLLCKNVILTKPKIEYIRRFMETKKNIYMSKEERQRLLRETDYFQKIQTKIEQEIGYDTMKNIADDLLNNVQQTGVVSKEMADGLAEEVEGKLIAFDDAQVMQCLNGIRGVDEYLYIHCLNVGMLNGMMAKWCGLDKDQYSKLVKAGLVHDLGKLQISPEILNKPGRLTDLEFESIKRHPGFSYEILRSSGEQDEMILDAALHHHERVNQTGYPDKLGMDEISVGARITAISDVYDAMVAKRPYKEASTPFVILQELMDNAFSGLDRNYVDILIKNMTKALQGRQVLLSTGALATVEYIDSSKPQYPIVNMDGEMIMTNEIIYCEKVYAG